LGARGPGAKPTRKRADKNSGNCCPGEKPWQRPRLTRAGRVIAFIESLMLTAGKHAGKPFRLRPWQKRMIRAIYRTKGGRRVVRQALFTCGRKNGKTQLAAALALCHLAGPESESRGEVYSAAADRNQAARTFRELEAFILADADLASRCSIRRFHKQIEVADGEGVGSTYEALSSDATKAHSLSPSAIVMDELAQWRGRELFDNLMTGVGAREEPLVVVISTKSPDPHSVMSEVTDYARQVRDGVVIDETFAPFIWEVADDVDPLEDESCWKRANPGLGDFRSLEEMREAAEKARRIPARVAAFRRLYCNQGYEDEGDKFIPLREWQACADTYTLEDLRGQRAYGGLDLGSTRDLTAFALYFPDAGGATLVWTWCPGESIDQRAVNDKVPYREWRDAGWIISTPGKATDKRAVVRTIAELATTFEIVAIGYDRWGMAEVERICDEEGITLPWRKHGQGFVDMAKSVSSFEERILNREFLHNGSPLLVWALSNVRLSYDAAENRKPDKDRARERIDPIVALIMAVGIASREPAPTIYDFSLQAVLTA
jgi:phage terminase large subunit-like protein